jgi:carbon storage regulator
MLKLVRGEGEKIVIGDNIIVEVKMISPLKVRIGIQAPRDVVVDRAEVRTRKQQAQRRQQEGR